MTTISRAETGFNETDLKIGVAFGAGMTGDEAAAFCERSRSTVYERKGTNGDFIEMVVSLVKLATAASLADAAKRIAKRYEGMFEKAVGVIDETLDLDDDPRLRFNAATRVVDEFKGKPVQRIEQRVETTTTHKVEIVSLPSAELNYLLEAVKGTRAVLTGAPPEDIIEAEEIRDDTADAESAEGGI